MKYEAGKGVNRKGGSGLVGRNLVSKSDFAPRVSLKEEKRDCRKFFPARPGLMEGCALLRTVCRWQVGCPAQEVVSGQGELGHKEDEGSQGHPGVTVRSR